MNIDWRDAFKRYSDRVGHYEGVDFLYERDWTPEEWEAIQEIRNEIREEWDNGRME